MPLLKDPTFWYGKLKAKDQQMNQLRLSLQEQQGTIQGLEQLVSNKSAMVEQLELRIKEMSNEMEYCDKRNESLERRNDLKETIVS